MHPLAANINRVVLVGQSAGATRSCATRQAEPRFASLRLAVNTRRKDSATGEWGEKPNYFDITVLGNQGENCAQYSPSGRPVAVRRGASEWRDCGRRGNGTEAPAVEIVADSVPVPGRPRARDGAATRAQFVPAGAALPTKSDFGSGPARRRHPVS
jgi:single-strand DNA-binding protein